MNHARCVVVAIGAFLVVVAVACEPGSCTRAREASMKQIDSMCDGRTFKNTQFCSVCVSHGYYSIDDSCTCRELNFDAEFCLYADSDSSIDVGAPKVRDALIYAAEVCRDRSASLPYGPRDESDEDSGVEP